MKKLFILLIASISLAIQGYAQAPDILPQVFSPNAAELGKYGKVPVNYFNGLPNITIPLTEVHAKDYTLPIYLSYHASGNKPDQHPGWVGQGWTLHAGGCISRVMRGMKDEMTIKEASYDWGKVYDSNPGYLYLSDSFQSKDWSRGFRSNEIKDEYDLEPDEFQINVEGLSASFYFIGKDKVKIVSQTDDDFTVKFSMNEKAQFISPFYVLDYKFGYQHVKTFDTFNEFIVTTKDGTQYYFGGEENAIEYSIYNIVHDYSLVYSDLCEQDWDLRATANTWMLTKIARPNGEEILFNYKRAGVPIVMVDSHRIKAEYWDNSRLPNGENTYMVEDDWGWVYRGRYRNYTFYFLLQSYLESISCGVAKDEVLFKTCESVQLDYDYRADLFYERVGDNGLYEYLNSGYNHYEQLASLDYPGGSIMFQYTKDPNVRLRLETLKIVAEQSDTLKYEMTYDSTPLPRYYSRQTDPWGYYNYPRAFSLRAQSKQDRYVANPALLQAQVLLQIKYPTGGRTTYEYEPHDYSRVVKQYPFYTIVRNGQAGGLRIKRITDYANNGKKEERIFTYTQNGGESSGILSGDPEYGINADIDLDHVDKPDLGNDGFFHICYFSENLLNQLSDTDGNHVTYSVVVEKIPGAGSTKYRYSNHDTEGCLDRAPLDVSESDGFPDSFEYSFSSMSLGRGLLLSKTTYGNRGVVKEEQFSYERDTLDCLYSIPTYYNDYFPSKIYRRSLKKIYTFYPKLTRKEIVTYPDDNGRPLLEVYEYEYNRHRDIVRTKKSNGTCSEEKLVTYNGDITEGDAVYQQMQSDGIYNRPVEQTLLRNGKVVASTLTTYKSTAWDALGQFAPSKYYEARLKDPLPYSAWHQFKGSFLTTQYQIYGAPRMSFDQYDGGLCNILLATEESGLSYRYIWDYDGLYPEACFTGIMSERSMKLLRETAHQDVNFMGKGLKEYTFEFDAEWPGILSFSMEWPAWPDSYSMKGTLDGAPLFNYEAPGGGNVAMSMGVSVQAVSTNVQDPPTELCHKSITVGHHVLKISSSPVKVGRLELVPFLGGACRISYPVLRTEEKVKTPDIWLYDFDDDGGSHYAFNSARGWPGSFPVSKQISTGVSYRIDWMQQDRKGDVWESHSAPFAGDMMVGDDAYAIDNVRIYPSNVMATTWTWTRNGNLRSTMSECGITSSYEYDGLRRLVTTRGTDGQKVASYEYRYDTSRMSNTPNSYVKTSIYTDNTGNAAKETMCYVDGLGRPWQTLRLNVNDENGNTWDVAETTEYDKAGRPFRTWLPNPTSTSFPEEEIEIFYSDYEPFSLIEYDGSPLNRRMKEYGPGERWHNYEKGVSYAFFTNGTSASLNCNQISLTWLSDTTASIVRGGSVTAGTLSVNRVKDENNLAVYSFSDIYGQVILERHHPVSGEDADTYFVYDDMGRLSAVLPPALSRESEFTLSEIDKYAYLYRYDSRGNCIAKKLPGCGWTYYIYDKGGRLVFTQDAECRKLNRWMFSISDIHGRLCLTGFCEEDADVLRASATSANIVAIAQEGTLYGYSISNMELDNYVVLSVSYYDDYRKTPSSLSYCPRYGLSKNENVYGLLTGKAERILGEEITNDFRWSAFYYDTKGNVIQTNTTRRDGGIDVSTTETTYTGKPLRMCLIHRYGAPDELAEFYEYEYDNWERPLKVRHRIGEDGDWTVLSDVTYDAVGRVTSNEINNNPSLKTSFTYNVRSWPKSICGPGLKEALQYENNNQWGGNITRATYDYGGVEFSNEYSYDGMSRLIGVSTELSNACLTESFSYDNHSNVVAYERTGVNAVKESMSYIGNRLISVSSSMSERSGFISYDSVGRVVSSDIDGMTEVRYNVAGFPSLIGQTDGGYVHHTYAADGTRLSSRRTESNGVVTLMDYEGNQVIENGKPRMLLFGGGYVDFSGSNPRYCWYTKDHLGNVRAVLDEDGDVFAAYSYYAYGEDLEVPNLWPNTMTPTKRRVDEDASADGRHLGKYVVMPSVTYSPDEGCNWQPYKFGGKESLSRVGLDLYDFGERMYSPSNMRWLTMDPLCEKYYSVSPYVYCGGNPVRFSDPDGCDRRDKVAGFAIGTITNVIPGTGFVRDWYTPTDPKDYNDALKTTDAVAASVGAGMAVAGGEMVIAGGETVAAGAGVAVAFAGVGAATMQPEVVAAGGTVGGAIATSGAEVAVAGGVMVIAGARLFRNSVSNSSEGYERGNTGGNTTSTNNDKGNVNKINDAIHKGNAPASIERADTPKVKGEQPHVHFKDGSALNKDGTMKHKPRKGNDHRVTNKEKEFLKNYGWEIK